MTTKESFLRAMITVDMTNNQAVNHFTHVLCVYHGYKREQVAEVIGMNQSALSRIINNHKCKQAKDVYVVALQQLCERLDKSRFKTPKEPRTGTRT